VTFGREIDAGASVAMMDFAAAQGISLFDTAPAYASGRSEEIVGQWLAARRPDLPQPTVATKVLPPYTAASLNTSVAGSLQRLGVPHLDLLFLHRWHDSLLNAEAYEALADLVQRGAVRAMGLSNLDAPQLEEALAWQARVGSPRFAWVQNIHNFAVRGFDEALRCRCRAADIHMMGYSPVGAGFLTGKHRSGVVPGSRFEIIPGHQGIYFTPVAQQRLAHLEAVAQRHGRSPVDLALAWATRQPDIGLVLVGGRTPEQILQILRARAEDCHSLLRELEAVDGP
jgi:aryl-alcohol dehydrogenase-like predicted oxidoreductase